MTEVTLAHSVHMAVGLAFDVQKTQYTRSGFEPAPFDLGSGKELFGALRLDGFAALLRIGFAKRLVIAGGNEGRYAGETPVINRAWAIREMLIHDFGIDPDRVESVASNSNTGGNIAAITAKFEWVKITTGEAALVTSHYHIPRADMDLRSARLLMPAYSAEAFWLLEGGGRKYHLIERLGGGPLASRIAEEIQGIADKFRGAYKPRTDTPHLGQ